MFIASSIACASELKTVASVGRRHDRVTPFEIAAAATEFASF
jgi:hypothetical protein